jgi:polyhydroxybutyrate depolymerase
VKIPAALLLAAALLACGAPPKTAHEEKLPDPLPVAPATAFVDHALTVGTAKRHYELLLPASTGPTSAGAEAKAPLVIILHGYTSNGERQDGVFGFSANADKHGFAVARAEGTVDTDNHPFWDASLACCDWKGAHPDDVGYLDALIDDAVATGKIDASRIYLLGHSNGAFMAYRYGCTGHRPIAGLAALAGLPELDPAVCKPMKPFSVFHLHGEQDWGIPAKGGVLDPARPGFPSADETLARFAKHAHCTGPIVADRGHADNEREVPGAETRGVQATGCPSGLAVRGWFFAKMGHDPAFRSSMTDALYTFFERALPFTNASEIAGSGVARDGGPTSKGALPQ